MVDHAQGQPGADRAVGRPGPAARMAEPAGTRPRPSVLIPPVTPGGASAGPAPMPQAPVAPQATPGHVPAGAPAAPATGAPVAAQRQAAPATPVAQPAARPAPTSAARVARTAVRPSQGPRAARVYLTHIDPWSVMKQAFLLSLALAVVILVAAATLWFALESAGVLDAITRTATDVGGESGASVSSFLDFGRVMGFGLVIAGIETVLITALATLFAFLYNLSVGIGGGLEITLSEDDF